MGQTATSSSWVLVSEYEGYPYVSVYEKPSSSSEVIGSIASGVKAQLKSVDEASGFVLVSSKTFKGWLEKTNIHRLHWQTLDFSSLASVSASKPNKRLTSEIKQLSEMSFAKHGMTARVPKGVEHPNVISVYIQGPEESEYSEYTFEVKVSFPEGFPEQAPALQFLSPIYHPNISQAGNVCLDALGLGWSSTSNKASWIRENGLPDIEGDAVEITCTCGVHSLEDIQRACESHPDCVGFAYRPTTQQWYPKKKDAGFIASSATYSQKIWGETWEWYYLPSRTQERAAEFVQFDGHAEVRVFDKPDANHRSMIGTIPSHTRGTVAGGTSEGGDYFLANAGGLKGWVGIKNVKFLQGTQDEASTDTLIHVDSYCDSRSAAHAKASPQPSAKDEVRMGGRLGLNALMQQNSKKTDGSPNKSCQDSPSNTCTSVKELLEAARDLLASPKEDQAPLNVEAHELFRADKKRFTSRLEEETFKSTDFSDFGHSNSVTSTRSSMSSLSSLRTSLITSSRPSISS
jgi:ubiquitin-protein ligase